ncbi:MAG: S16 family serine protease [Candidatus Thermoplasmatota archaeon]
MKKSLVLFVSLILVLTLGFTDFSQAVSVPGSIYEGGAKIEYRNTTVYAPAVARTEDGYKGVISTITVTIQSNGSGRVFVDTLPLTQVDMQGSARLSVKVASTLIQRDKNCEADPSSFDYFFVVRTSAPIIGGPSAGAIMTVATVSLLENWSMNKETMMTGMINPDGSIGPVGGITHKIDAAASVGATRFLIPKGQGTYTEMIQEEKGWIKVTTPITRNVADYALKKYGIEVVEVADIKEVIENFTGYQFTFSTSNKEISTEEYKNSMNPLASELLKDAQKSFYEADNKLENTSIPGGIFKSPQEEIDQAYNTAKKRLKESEKWYNKNLFYTSTTKSFQSLIYSRYVSYACDFFNSEYQKSFMDDLIEKIELKYNSTQSTVKNKDINGFISLQCIGGAQSRASEARSYLIQLKQKYNSNGLSSYSDVLDILYQLAFITERCNSVGWWINLSHNFAKTFHENENISSETIKGLAIEYINEAEQATTYSNVILQEAGQSSNYLSAASNLLQEAKNDKDKGYPASALFKALEALTRANLAIETIGIDNKNALKDKIQISEESTQVSISESRSQGIEPVMAVSYYELAETYANETDYESALLYYKLSEMIAGALSYTNTSCDTSTSRYVGLPKTQNNFWRIFFNYSDIMLFAAAAIFIGTIGGLGIGWGLGKRSIRKERERLKEKWAPRSIEKYQKNKGKYQDEKNPESIEDYYKK